ncbi:MAG TPA: SPOR domain-containing protein [Ramlibacter sp.]|nr:SPOR domain-containing protein [Ramlibacter sp.]
MKLNSMYPTRQRGSTTTGIIIGLILGLVIAVIVALVITKGATPFTDRGGKFGKGDPTPAQVADPNRPLYGDRDAAREANKQIVERARPAEDPLGEAIAEMAPEGAAAATAPAAAPAVAGAAPAAAPAAPAAPAVAPGEVVYYLQAGAFRELADAENSRAKLALLGFEASVSDRNSEGGVLHRVRIGPFNQEAMTRARAKLLDAGVDVAIVRNQQ